MNPQEPILPEIFEDVINNFIIDENNLLMNYVEVHDVKLEYYASFENYILDVTAYVKEGNLGENNTWNGVGPSIKWSSFVNRLSRNKIFKNYLGLPLNNNYENFYISINGDVKEGFPKEEKIMETKDLIKKVLKELNNKGIIKVKNFKKMIYKFRVILDAKEDIFRDIAIEKEATLEDFHNTIVNAFGFDGSEMASFYTCDDEWNQEDEIPLFDMGDVPGEIRIMNNFILEDNLDKYQSKIIYVYDFFNIWTFLKNI